MRFIERNVRGNILFFVGIGVGDMVLVNNEVSRKVVFFEMGG